MSFVSSNLRRTLFTATTKNLARPITARSQFIAPRFTQQQSIVSRRTFAAMSEHKVGVHNLTSKKEFDDAINQSNRLVVIDCFATWCGPCKMIAPQLVKFSEQYTDTFFGKIDVDDLPDVAQQLGVRAMPTFILFKNGEKVQEVVGANVKALQAAIEEGQKA